MSRITCPVCGTATSLNPVTIESESAYLPEESSPNKAIYGKARVFAIKDAEYPYKVSYGIYQCQACSERFVAKLENYVDTEWVPVYPILYKPISEDVPPPIKSDFEEANLCFVVGAYKACASMCQIALEALWRDKQVSGLKELSDKGIIAPQIYERANEIRQWGNVVKHSPITDEILKEDAEQLVAYLDKILNEVYIEPKRFDALRQKREQIEEKPD
jgi:hypothetical protein